MTDCPDHNTQGKLAAQKEFLFNRLSRRFRHLKKWANRIGTNAFRLYDRDIPEIPLVLDLYGDAVSGAVYKNRRAEEAGPGEAEEWLSAMKAAIAGALDIREDCVFLKERRRLRNRREAGNQYGKIREQGFYRDVYEGGLRFRVNLSDYLDTGLFLDARKKREYIRAESDGKKVLNLFAYTCSLSAAAAKGGACRVDSVDLSNTYLEWGKVNFALNSIEESGRFSFIRSDVMRYIAEAAEKGLRWDIIILDPPSFSNSKKMEGTLDIKRDHSALIQRCLSLLEQKGILIFSSNAKGFKLDAGNYPAFETKNMETLFTDEDFRGKKIPLCCLLTK